MPKPVSILVVLCAFLIFNILFSTATEIELSLLNHDQTLLLLQQNISTTINDFLIYPHPHAFKFFILPYLTSKSFMRTYEQHLKILHPKLTVGKLLDYCETSNVIDFKETKTLYYINQNKPSPLNTIVYSENSKIAFIPEIVSSEIKRNETCALLLSNQIFPFKSHAPVHEGSIRCVWVARNLNNIFVALKLNVNTFTPIARGILYEIENFDKDLECILTIHRLNGLEKFVITTRYFFTIPFVKYFEHFSPLLGICFNKLKDYTWCDLTTMKFNRKKVTKSFLHSKMAQNVSKLILSRILWAIICFTHMSIELCIFTSPFNLVTQYAAPIIFSNPGFVTKLMSFMIFFSFVWISDENNFSRNLIFDFFIKTLKNDVCGRRFVAKDHENFLIFKIEPKNTMWALPFVVERQLTKYNCSFRIFFWTCVYLGAFYLWCLLKFSRNYKFSFL